IEAGYSDDKPQCRLLLIQEERCVAPGRRGIRWVLLEAVEPRHEHMPGPPEGIVGRSCAIIVQAENGAGEMGVVRFGPAEVVVGTKQGVARLGGAVEKVLQPAAPAGVTDKNVQLAVRSELDYSAVVIAATGRGSRLGEERRLQRSQPDYVLVQRQRRSVPHEPVHPVAQ